MSKARRKNTPVIPSSPMFNIPDVYQNTISSKRFLLVDMFLKRGQNRVLIYSSDQQLEMLFESDTVFMDGTFDVTPSQFKQVFIMHVRKFGQGTWKINHPFLYILIRLFYVAGLPVAFCLLPNKRGSTYTDLFERLKDQAILVGKEFNPRCIISDYETGLLPVVQQEVSISPLMIYIQHI